MPHYLKTAHPKYKPFTFGFLTFAMAAHLTQKHFLLVYAALSIGCSFAAATFFKEDYPAKLSTKFLRKMGVFAEPLREQEKSPKQCRKRTNIRGY